MMSANAAAKAAAQFRTEHPHASIEEAFIAGALHERRSPTENSWFAAKQRCTNPSSDSYPRYGGRGIRMCEAWVNDFAAFFADMGERPPGTTLDRIEVNGDYEPSNCRWATVKQQQRNTRRNRFIEIDGERKAVVQWSEDVGTHPHVIVKRLDRGWSPRDAVFAPHGARRKALEADRA